MVFEIQGCSDHQSGKPEEIKFEEKVSDAVPAEIHKSKKRLILLLSGILVIVVIIVTALFVFNIIGGEIQSKEIDKSIAVLPFKSLSDDPEKQYLADGMMDAVVLHLSKLEICVCCQGHLLNNTRNPVKR